MASLLRSPAVQATLGTALAAHMALVKRTTRWDILGFERVQPIVESGEGLIALTFHNRFLMLNSAWEKGWQMPHVMISRSRDGNVVHRTSRALGLRTIRGSTRKLTSDRDKGGASAGNAALRALEQGGCIVITPDGPRGPRQRVQPGALRLAKLSGAPIVPCAFAVSRRRTLDTWDRMVVPKLFGRGIIQWGEPMHVGRDADVDALRAELETRMNADLAAADRAVGHETCPPA